MKWDVAARLLELVFGFVTAAASVALVCVAMMALDEARREWLVVPAPENFRGTLSNDREVHLSWDPPRSGVEMIDHFAILRWSNQGEQPWAVMETINRQPPEKLFSTTELCEKSSEAASLICIYRVRVIAVNHRKGELSRRVVCTSKKCGYVPDEESETVWQPYR
jgi:hypothetical protein